MPSRLSYCVVCDLMTILEKSPQQHKTGINGRFHYSYVTNEPLLRYQSNVGSERHYYVKRCVFWAERVLRHFNCFHWRQTIESAFLINDTDDICSSSAKRLKYLCITDYNYRHYTWWLLHRCDTLRRFADYHTDTDTDTRQLVIVIRDALVYLIIYIVFLTKRV